MERTRSLFARALKDLMDVAKLSQVQWAEVLIVTPGAISQWLSDTTFPQAQHISAILAVIDPGGPYKGPLYGAEAVLENFYRMMELPAEEVTPHHEKIRKNVGYYLSSHKYIGLHGRINAMVFANTYRRNRENAQKIAEFLNTLVS